MKLDFNQLSYNELHNFKGGQGVLLSKIILEGDKKIMHHIIKKGCSVGKHKHIDDQEIVYVLKGIATINDDDETYELHKDCAHICLKGHRHEIINNHEEDLEIFAIVCK